ncbi:MAG: RNHCP domain-containing protein [Bacilli bacterium]|nr:RNHCP domain-containing protein [Bacilli bacterium]
METKRFKMIDEEFMCVVCGKKVEPLKYSARDHCPYCLCSIHVDINPGDRQNECKGILRPIEIDKFKDTYKIVYRCEKCNQTHRNVMANDDDFDKIIEVMKNVR